MKLTSIKDLESGAADQIILDKSVNLGALYDELLDSYEEGEDDHRAPGVHASEVASCKRHVVYTLYATEKKKTTKRDMQKRFNVGNAIHGMLQSDFAKMAKRSGGTIIFKDEVKMTGSPLAEKYDIHSSCDGVFEFLNPSGEVYLRIGLEIKSKAPDDYAKLKEPEKKHIEQAHLYQACLDLPLVWYVYWNKGNQNYTPMTFPWLRKFDHNVWNRLEKRIIESLEAAHADVLPEREEAFHCTWCPYAWTCEPSTIKKQNNGGQRITPRSLTNRRR